MSRKVIIDCDPGIDDAVALAMALFDPRLDVLAITACGGTVPAERATQNVQVLVEQIDPPRHPRIAMAPDCDCAPIDDGQDLHGQDGLGNLDLQPIGRQHIAASEKLIAEIVRQHPGQVTILCLGPMTGVANAIKRNPTVREDIDRLVIVGGALRVSGDVTATAEFNMHFDPQSAREVFRSPITKTIVAMDVVRELKFGLRFVEQLPDKYSRIGQILHPMMNHLYRAFRQQRGAETVLLPGVVGLLMLTNPELFETEEVAVDVETKGTLTRGMTIFDRRPFVSQRRDIESASKIDAEAAMDCVVNTLKFASQTNDRG